MGAREATLGIVDLAGFCALTEAHGDAEAVSLIDRFEGIARACLGSDGDLVKTVGDAVMIACPSPNGALGATRRIFAASAQELAFPAVRAGLHHGPVTERRGDLFGATVNLAARVAAEARGGQALGTEVVAAAARAEGIPVSELGAFELRNLASPVELFDIHVCEARRGISIDPVCRMQVAPDEAAGRLRHHGAVFHFCSLGCVETFARDPDRYAQGGAR